MQKRRVIVVGAGPAGLAAAWELVQTGHEVTVLERDLEYVGGLSRTMHYHGFRFDIGAHRFYSKNSEMVRWWKERLPDDFVRIKRKTRILTGGKFFHYPLQAEEALLGMGLWASAACVLSYLRRQFAPIRPEQSFRDWVSNRFGDKLYRMFFKTYTEKVWGMPCEEISADWASQRIRGLSLRTAVLGAVRSGHSPKNSIKTLADEFDYPRLGAGMLWEKTRDEIVRQGGQVMMGRPVSRIVRSGNRITSLETTSPSGQKEQWTGDTFIVSMPLRECVSSMDPLLDDSTCQSARQLRYRDFILVALIVQRTNLFPDNWIYVHDPSVKVGRIENYSNWTQEMAPRSDATCLEMEYFCSVKDAFWKMSDVDILALAKKEIEQLGLAKATEIVDGCVVRVEKAYPVYDATYAENVARIRAALGEIENLQVIGRNGMHKYNNQDHSMLTGILAARNIDGEQKDVWKVNTDAEYLEGSAGEGRTVPRPLAPEN